MPIRSAGSSLSRLVRQSTISARRGFSSAATVRMAPIVWDHRQTPYAKARRDEGFSEAFESKQRGKVDVADPYHWLQTPPSQSEETKRFVEEQAAFTQAYLEKNQDRDKLHAALKQNWDYPRFSCPSRKDDGYYYYNFNTGLQAQSPIYRVPASSLSPPSPTASPTDPGGELFFDPNLLSEDGTASLAGIKWSKNGEFVVYAISRSGSDWNTVYVRRSDSPHKVSADDGGQRGTDEGRLDDVVRFIKFSGLTWLHDSSGFLYQRFAERKDHGKDTDDHAGTETDSDINAMLYFHRLGTPQSEDVLVMKDPDNPTYMWGTSITDDGRFLSLTTSKDTGRSNRLWVADLSKAARDADGRIELGMGKLGWDKIVDEFGSEFGVVGNDGSRLYIQTNRDAPKSKLVAYDVDRPSDGFVDLIPEDPDAILEAISPTNKDFAVVSYSRDVKDELYLYELATGKRLARIGQDLIGTVGQIAGRREDDEFFFSLASFLSPGTAYRYSFGKKEEDRLSVFRQTQLPAFNADDFVEEQVFYHSKDGTKVPMFIVHGKDIKKDGQAPIIQYGYGGFSISITPFFSPSLMTVVSKYGAVLAVPNIRGGGEYGEEWHQAGTFGNKQNVFDDFQYATKYLVDNKYGTAGRVTISGGSNGGLLVAACANQAPELYGAVVADVGVHDMLRFHRFTIGRAWTADYGCSDDPEAFDYLFEYSPLHNVDAKASYPAMMLLTADHDDRVVPSHSFKLAAELQHRRKDNDRPLLLRVDLKAGHGAGKSTEAKIKEAADKWGFVAASLGLEWKD